MQELQLHLGVLQQHAALIGGPNATSCPICHKLFLGADALMEHMKHSHKDPSNNTPPVAAATTAAATTASKNLTIMNQLLIYFMRKKCYSSSESSQWFWNSVN